MFFGFLSTFSFCIPSTNQHPPFAWEEGGSVELWRHETHGRTWVGRVWVEDGVRFPPSDFQGTGTSALAVDLCSFGQLQVNSHVGLQNHELSLRLGSANLRWQVVNILSSRPWSSPRCVCGMLVCPWRLRVIRLLVAFTATLRDPARNITLVAPVELGYHGVDMTADSEQLSRALRSGVQTCLRV